MLYRITLILVGGGLLFVNMMLFGMHCASLSECAHHEIVTDFILM
jgi:hypothetical protein